jgi:hypothetical protein
MTVPDDDDWPDQIEYDPRWEVQPEPGRDDDPGGNMRVTLIAVLVMAVFVALLAWLVLSTPPAF